MTPDNFQRVVERTGAHVEPLAEAERWALLQEWRQVYAASLHASTGRWKRGQFEWHVFSFGDTRALNGEKAVAAYAAEQPMELIVCPESEQWTAMRLHGGSLPSFREECYDVYVWPLDLAWTMAFTHEESIWLGPYFSRREWALLGPVRAKRRK